MSDHRADKILIGRQAIMDWIGIQSVPVFYDFMSKGLPCRAIGGRLYAHEDNLSDYFRRSTCGPAGEVDLNAE